MANFKLSHTECPHAIVYLVQKCAFGLEVQLDKG